MRICSRTFSRSRPKDRVGARVGTWPASSRYRGMTLIEILMVLAIVGLVVQAAASGFGPALEAEKMRAVNQVVSTINYAYNRARVHGVYLRMEIDLKEKRFSLQEANEAMYLPSTDRNGRIVEIDERDIEDRDARDKAAAESFNDSILNKLQEIPGQVFGGGDDEGSEEGLGEGEEAAPQDPYAVTPRAVPRARPPLFSAFKEENALSGLGEPIKFPEGIKVLGVRTDSDLKEITEGKAYLYFFPSGRTQKAHIMLQDEQEAKEDEYAGSTIVVSPLTGRVKVLPVIKKLDLPEDHRGGEDDLGRKIERRTF